MAVITLPNEDIINLVKACGLDIERCVSFTLKIKVGEIVSVKVKSYLIEKDIVKGAEEVVTVMKKYELVEKKK